MRSVRGMQNVNRSQRGVDVLFFEPVADEADDVENFGIDFEEPAPKEVEADRVMSSIECPPTPGQLTRLQEQVDPLAESVDGFGIDLF